jgi:chemosensory pili system protein ChpA (sensor histidine kinase/response regulator)
MKTLHDGRQAIQFLENAHTPPAAVLTDLDLPRVDGYELIRWMRTQPGLLHTPVIAMSARRDEAGALAAGANRFLLKPYSAAEIREIVKEWMHA